MVVQNRRRRKLKQTHYIRTCTVVRQNTCRYVELQRQPLGASKSVRGREGVAKEGLNNGQRRRLVREMVTCGVVERIML